MRWMIVRTGDSATATTAVPRNQRVRAQIIIEKEEGTFKPFPTFYKIVASILCMSCHC